MHGHSLLPPTAPRRASTRAGFLPVPPSRRGADNPRQGHEALRSLQPERGPAAALRAQDTLWARSGTGLHSLPCSPETQDDD